MTARESEPAAAEGPSVRGAQRVSLLAGPTAGIAFVGGTLLAAARTPSAEWTGQPFDALGVILHLSVIVGSLLGIVFLVSVWGNAEHRIQRAGIGLFGIALLMMALVNAIEVAFTTFPEPAGILGVRGFMIGLSVLLADGSPRLAKLGVGLVALPTLFVLSLLLCVTVVSVLGLPSPTKVLPALEVVTGTVFLMAAAGITALSIAGLRTDACSRTTGGALIAFAAAWFLLSVAMLRCGHYQT